MPAIAPAVFRLADGQRTIAQIHQAMVGRSLPGAAADPQAFLAEFNRLFFAVNGVDRMFLRYPTDTS